MWVVMPLISYFVYKFYCCNNRDKPLQEKHYQKDKVYLYQFPPADTVPNISPYCLKLETFLRANNIQYENRFVTMGRSKYGLVPFIELNGEHIADSQIIEERLRAKFNLKSDLSDRDEAFSRAVARMVEHHTFNATSSTSTKCWMILPTWSN